MSPARADGYIPPCIPTRAHKPPAGPGWVHEIKHDGFRLQVRRDGDVVRLFTRRGYDWSGRYPAIVVTAMQLRASSFTLDGEAVVCGPDGVAIFVGIVLSEHTDEDGARVVARIADIVEQNFGGCWRPVGAWMTFTRSSHRC
jgi:ATP-dependent DNA ligase